MNKQKLTAAFGGLATAGYVLRRLVYAGAVDGKNLIVTGHPFVIGLWVLTAAALALAAFAGWKQKESKLFEENFAVSAPAFLGHGLLGVGAALTVCFNPLPMPGRLGLLWKILGLSGAVCLLVAGFERMRGKRPFFALYALPCLFFAMHVVAHYQIWCANPQFTDYAFALLSSVALSLLSYQLTAFSEDLGSRRVLTVTALAAVYLCGAELAGSLYPYLYIGGILFALTALPQKK